MTKMYNIYKMIKENNSNKITAKNFIKYLVKLVVFKYRIYIQ